MSTLDSALESISKEALDLIAQALTSPEVEDLRVRFMGKKGKLSEVLQSLKDLSPEERKNVGAKANKIKTTLESQISERLSALSNQELEQELLKDRLDPTIPGVHFASGERHPIRTTLREAVEIFERAGLTPVYGPEVEFEEYCFDRLNFQPGHPARDMQATFFMEDEARSLVLRTHTSPVQVRVLMRAAKEGMKLPIRVSVPGRVYRCDDDATHSPMFHQIEGLAVDTTSTMGDLKAVLDFFFRKFFNDESLRVRFRPSFFPFTEPSAEVDLSCVFCKGKGCRVCKQSGWIEIAGAGMVHPRVFEACGWNSSKVQGWAFGMGIERLTMLKRGVPDLRLFFENRLSFLGGRA